MERLIYLDNAATTKTAPEDTENNTQLALKIKGETYRCVPVQSGQFWIGQEFLVQGSENWKQQIMRR